MKRTRPRNGSIFDGWSVVHLVTGIALGWLINPWLALAVMILWEPLEVLVLSPLLAKINIDFGYETLRNSLSDIFFDIVGVCIGYFWLSRIIELPVRLF